jgi:hypothetical protein
MYRDFSNSVMSYEREKDVANMPKVSDDWDWQNGVVGEFRYRSI